MKDGPLACFAFGPDPPAMGIDDAVGDVEAQAKATLVVFAGLPKAGEDRLQHFALFERSLGDGLAGSAEVQRVAH
jgi:hypothetical protein